MHPASEETDAQMAESVDALVSNTCGCKAVPVRPRLWVQSLIRKYRALLFIFYLLVLIEYRQIYEYIWLWMH